MVMMVVVVMMMMVVVMMMMMMLMMIQYRRAIDAQQLVGAAHWTPSPTAGNLVMGRVGGGIIQ